MRQFDELFGGAAASAAPFVITPGTSLAAQLNFDAAYPPSAVGPRLAGNRRMLSIAAAVPSAPGGPVGLCGESLAPRRAEKFGAAIRHRNATNGRVWGPTQRRKGLNGSYLRNSVRPSSGEDRIRSGPFRNFGSHRQFRPQLHMTYAVVVAGICSCVITDSHLLST